MGYLASVVMLADMEITNSTHINYLLSDKSKSKLAQPVVGRNFVAGLEQTNSMWLVLSLVHVVTLNFEIVAGQAKVRNRDESIETHLQLLAGQMVLVTSLFSTVSRGQLIDVSDNLCWLHSEGKLVALPLANLISISLWKTTNQDY